MEQLCLDTKDTVRRSGRCISVAVTVETYADVYFDIMMFLCGGSLACEKANRFLEG